ncbi:allantoate permease [Thozetella sp. PMI_491]|nr:allantoate permease [Thozetella sp. PMI_491]
MSTEKTTKDFQADAVAAADVEEGHVNKSDLTAEEAEHQLALEGYVPGSDAEKRLVRKIDWFLLPTIWWMYILAYLDRGNISNANAAGLSDDLHASPAQYSLLISIFFLGYFLCEVPSNLLMVRLSPAIYLPTIMVIWGVIVCGLSQATTFEGFITGRFFLGCIEGGLFPACLYLLTCWYKKDELAKRTSIFFTSSCVSPALGGIMAGAIIGSLEGARGWPGWRWLFLIEGVSAVFFGIIFYFVLSDYPLKSKHLTPEERTLAYVRILHDRQINVSQATLRLTAWQSLLAAAADARTWVLALIYILDDSSTTIVYFIPTILKTYMGYSSVMTQWMTVPIYIVGAIGMIIFSYTSDKTGDRRLHAAGLLGLSFVACMVSMNVMSGVARYVMMCLLVAGLYTAIPLIFNYCSEVMPLPNEKRAVSLAIVNSMGNLSLMYGSYLWPSTDAPRYLLGFASVGAFSGAAAIIMLCLPWIFKLVVPAVPRTKAERDLLARAHM